MQTSQSHTQPILNTVNSPYYKYKMPHIPENINQKTLYFLTKNISFRIFQNLPFSTTIIAVFYPILQRTRTREGHRPSTTPAKHFLHTYQLIAPLPQYYIII